MTYRAICSGAAQEGEVRVGHGVDEEDVAMTLDIGLVDTNLAIETSRTEECLVKYIRSIGACSTNS